MQYLGYQKKYVTNFGIRCATALSECYYNGYELGRGANEGFTEWLCKEAGYGNHSYDEEYHIIALLELAIGKENIIKFGRGNIKEYIPKVLRMSSIECNVLLANIDDVYKRSWTVTQIQNIIKILNKFEKDIVTEEDKLELFQDYMDEYKIYAKMLKEMQLERNEESVDKQSQLEYFNNELEQKKMFLNISVTETEDKIFEKYFKHEIKRLQNAETISKEEIDRVNKLYLSLYGKDAFGDEEVLEFKNKTYNELQTKFMNTLKRSQSLTGKVKVFLKMCYFRYEKFVLNIVRKNKKDTTKTKNATDISKTVAVSQQFGEYISDMSNFSNDYTNQSDAKNIQEKEKKNFEIEDN